MAPGATGTDWRSRLPFFYGWWVVGACFLCLAITYGVYYSFSVYYVALLAEFGWGRAASAGVFSLFVIGMGIGGVGAGALADRIGPDRVVPAGTVVLALGLVACSRLTELWQFYLFFGVLCALGLSSAGWVPAMVAISRWFSARFGMAAGVASAGIGVGILVMVPLNQLLITGLGWRTAYVVMAGIILVGACPLSLLALGGKPEELGLLKDGGRSQSEIQDALKGSARRLGSRVVDHQWASREWTLPMAATTGRYWLLLALAALANVGPQMIFVHQVAFLTDGGYDRLLAASITGLVGLFSVGAKIGWGWVSDRLGREVTYSVGCGILAAAAAMLLATPGAPFPLLVYLYSVTFGIGYAVTSVLVPAASVDLFASRHFGTIYGTVNLAGGIGSALGAWFAGYVFDVTGSYFFAFASAAITSILSVACMWMAGPSRVRRPPGRS